MFPAIVWRPFAASLTITFLVVYSWFGKNHPDLSESTALETQTYSQQITPHQTSLQPIPKNIWQINFNHPRYTRLRDSVNSWQDKNPSYSHKVLEEQAGKQIVQKHYMGDPEIWNTYRELQSTILRADFLRYLVLAAHGGIYSDLDTDAIIPIDDWLTDYADEPVRAIVGIEYDQLNGPALPKGLYMPMQFCQWTLAFSAHHPLMLSMVDSVTQSLHQLAESQGVT